MTRREWKTIVLAAIERSGRPLSLWAVGEGPEATGRWFANVTDRQSGRHFHLSSVAEFEPERMVEDLVRQLTTSPVAANRRALMTGN